MDGIVMRIAIMAAGAVGAYFGARMADAGHDVFFIARGAHLEAIKKNGLKVDSALGNTVIKNANVTDDPKTVGPVDIVLFAVKLWDTEKAAAQMKPLIGPETRVISLQNGIDSYDRIAPIIGKEHAVGGATYVATVIAEPGVISQTSPFAKVVCGRMDGKDDPQLAAFVDAAKKAKIEIVLTREMPRELWQKFIFLSTLASMTAGSRQPIGPIMADADMKAFFRKLMEETRAVGIAKGVDVDQSYVEERMKFASETAPKGMKASMCHDLERGNRLELDWLAGAVCALGRELNVPTPANDAVYALLKPYRMGTQA
jgi:2-dehydropantoate 2-reductase